MVKVLSIDFGRAKVGIAVSSGSLADPLSVIRYTELDDLLVKIKKLAEEHKIERIVVGVSEGESAKASKEFGKSLGDYLNLPVIFYDETLTTYEVNQKSIEAGMSRKKRKNMEDAFAAALILQNYLDSL